MELTVMTDISLKINFASLTVKMRTASSSRTPPSSTDCFVVGVFGSKFKREAS